MGRTEPLASLTSVVFGSSSSAMPCTYCCCWASASFASGRVGTGAGFGGIGAMGVGE